MDILRESVTFESDAVEILSPGELCCYFDAATDESLPKHVLEDLVELLVVLKIRDHWQCILKEDNGSLKFS